MKRKILALVAIIMMVSISFGTVQAREERSKEEQTEVLFESISEDGIVKHERLSLSETELAIFVGKLSEVFRTINELKDLDQLFKMLKDLFGSESRLVSNMLKLFTKTGLLKNRALVLSHGSNLDFNPLNRNKIKLRNRFSFWRYGSGEGLPANTLILKPFKLKFNRLTGLQFGFMNRFLGLYIHVSRPLPQNSFTFFMGTAKNAFGVDFTP